MNSQDILLSTVEEVQVSFHGKSRDESAGCLIDETLTVAQNLVDIATDAKAISSYMLMAINRCIDFAKTQNRVRLKPKPETCEIKELMDMPLSCVCSMTVDFSANVAPFPAGLCSFIITDRLWVQESMFCLLSNAVKYSAKGHVDMFLILKNEDDVRAAMGFNANETECRFSTLLINPDDISGKVLLDESSKKILCVIVEDNGIGVPESAVVNLFRPFKQVRSLASEEIVDVSIHMFSCFHLFSCIFVVVYA